MCAASAYHEEGLSPMATDRASAPKPLPPLRVPTWDERPWLDAVAAWNLADSLRWAADNAEGHEFMRRVAQRLHSVAERLWQEGHAQ